MERPQPRTLLERLIQDSDRTLEEMCKDFERCARENRERGATLSVRQLGRWMAGAVDNARPASRRVARRLWGHSFKKLLGPPDVSTEAVAQAKEVATVVQIASQHEIRQETGRLPASFQEEIVMAAEESARFVRQTGVAVTPEVLEQLDADVKWLAVEYRRRPKYAVFRPLAGLRRDVFDMIDRHPRPSHLTDLYRVAGQLSSLLALASFDLGQPYAADNHARTAWLCADLAGDDTLRAYIRWVQSSVAYWRGEFRDAAELTRSGHRFAGGGSDLLRLASQEARALAAARDDREADRALGAAANARDRAAEGIRPAGVFYFEPGVAAYFASDARLSLGGEANARLAVSEAEEALELLGAAPEGEHPEQTAAAQLDLVAAQLALNDLDGASVHAQVVLRLPSENRTVPVMGRMAKIDQALDSAAFKDVILASDLREQIAVFSAYPATRELPQFPAS
ncbi:MAG: hypothetical protein ACRDSZ_19845 [Pseudonocardiaceae bacterium]